MYGIIQALITHSYERTRDLLYFGDTVAQKTVPMFGHFVMFRL